jgi:hypothetical protein
MQHNGDDSLEKWNRTERLTVYAPLYMLLGFHDSFWSVDLFWCLRRLVDQCFDVSEELLRSSLGWLIPVHFEVLRQQTREQG